jgi:SAM-dependent methyltransferase/uncharacterized protein YbaR (Trm112 family)
MHWKSPSNGKVYRMQTPLLEVLACPRHHCGLKDQTQILVCPHGCEYPFVQGVPVLLRDDVDHTLWVANASIEKSRQLRGQLSLDPCVETLGISRECRASLAAAVRNDTEGVDPVVSHLIGATNGNLYKSLIGRLPSYPIPNLRLPPGSGALFLDLGCNWGRWSIAAARSGYTVIGMDPSLGAVLAAKRVCRQLGANAHFIVGDSRHLPFARHILDVVFSYSVLQHFKKEDVQVTLSEVARALKPGGASIIQMANASGLRSLYHQARRGFHAGEKFEVRYWTRGELKRTFERIVGPTSLNVDCFFGLGVQQSDESILPGRDRLVVRASKAARSISDRFRVLEAFADSVYVHSTTRPALRPTGATRE